jgi:hypothetical protein
MSTVQDDSTTVPNWLFDEVMRHGSCAQLKVTATVIRYTLGAGHREAKLDNRFLVWCTGEGPDAVDRGVEEAVKRGFIVRRPFEDDWAYRVADLDQIRFTHDLSLVVLVPTDKTLGVQRNNR